MKLSFDRMDFLSGLLQSTTVAAILFAHPLAVSALTAQDIPQMMSPTAMSVDGSSDRSLVLDSFGEGNIARLHLDRDTKSLATQEEDPSPPRRREQGGSL